jgi:hypothetical protein
MAIGAKTVPLLSLAPILAAVALPLKRIILNLCGRTVFFVSGVPNPLN